MDVSVLGRSVTRAWRDDSVIFARLRPSAPQMVESWLAARVREEERRASAPGPSRLSFGPAAPRETRRAPTCDAARRANVRAGAPGRVRPGGTRGRGRRRSRAFEGGRGSNKSKRLDPRNRRRHMDTTRESARVTIQSQTQYVQGYVRRRRFSTSKLRRSGSVCFQSQENRSPTDSRPTDAIATIVICTSTRSRDASRRVRGRRTRVRAFAFGTRASAAAMSKPTRVGRRRKRDKSRAAKTIEGDAFLLQASVLVCSAASLGCTALQIVLYGGSEPAMVVVPLMYNVIVYGAVAYERFYLRVRPFRVLVHAHLTAVATLPAMLEMESCLLYTSPSPRDATLSRMPSSA